MSGETFTRYANRMKVLHAKGRLSIREAMDEIEPLLENRPEGTVGEEQTHLLKGTK